MYSQGSQQQPLAANSQIPWRDLCMAENVTKVEEKATLEQK